MATILVTGANRGLGFEFAKQLGSAGHTVFATVRSPEKALELNHLAETLAEVKLVALDVNDDRSLAAAVQEVQNHTEHLDWIINNAGVIGKAQGVEAQTREELQRVFATNSIAPLLVAQAFLPLLRKGTQPKLVNITSALGSIGSRDADWDGWYNYAYNASKSALNMMSRMLSFELAPHGIAVLALHPGWVATDMGGSDAPINPPDSVRRMLSVIEKLSPAQSGAYLDLDGRTVPW